ncbi:MAG: hypothetical protein AAB674_02510 [Patescibacteria group bacterium]
MKKELFLSISIISLGLAFSIFNLAFALSEKDIVYPVPELNGCKNETECRAYCDKPENIKPCVAFAEKYGLIEKEDAQKARKIIDIKDGPGGCKSQQECEAYCNEISNINECVDFAERSGLLSPKELEEAKKVREAVKQGAEMPGGCKTKEQCDAYCESPNHMEECIDFAIKAGIMPPEEQEEAQKMLQAVKKGAKPPACRNKRECDAFCSEESHFEECIGFAEAAGFMSKEEAMMVRKTGGKGPGGCKGKKECDAFCESGRENMAVCAEFALQNGMISQKDFEMMKKTGGKGPGGCKSKEDCEAFCNNPNNQETCFQFGLEHGMIPEEDLKNMERAKSEFKNAINSAPPEVVDCISQKIGPEMLVKFKEGTTMPPRDLGDKMRECFEMVMEKMGPPGEMGPPCESDNCPPSQEGQGFFNRARGFINQMMPGNNQNSGQPASVRVSINKESSGLYLLEIKAPNGIKEFSFTSEGSNPYSGGLSGCPNDYSNRTMIIFPVKAVITDCKDEVHEFTIQSEGSAKSGGNEQETQQKMQINTRQDMIGPGGCKSQQECEEFCKNNQKECMNFKPAGEPQQICKGNNCPPPDGINQQPPQGKQGIFDRAKNFIRQFAPGTEGEIPGKPCEGENCPPPGEMGQPCKDENCQQQMAPGINGGLQTPQFQNRSMRIPSPDEIQQMQERMMREETQQYMEERDNNNAPKMIREGMEIKEGQNFQPMQAPQGGFMPGTGGETGPMMPNSGGNYITPPQGQYEPTQFIPPATGPGAGGNFAPGESGPEPGTAPPGNVITPPTDGGGAPPPPTSFNSFQNLLVGLLSDLLRK